MYAFRYGILVTLIAMSAGCARTVINEGPHPAVRVQSPHIGVKLNNVALVDDSLAGKIAVEASDWQRTATDTAEVWAQLRNRTDYHYQLEARVQFFNHNKAPIDGPSAWQRLSLSPNSIGVYREHSTRTDVAYYYVEVREGR